MMTSAAGFAMICGMMLACAGAADQSAVRLGSPTDRPDRLIELTGERAEALQAEYSGDGGETWQAATICTGTTVDEWRTCGYAAWNAGAIEGTMPAGGQACVWNYFFDLALPRESVEFRLRDPDGATVLRQKVDLDEVGALTIIDHRNAAALAGGTLPSPWRLQAAGAKAPEVASLFCPVDDPKAPSLVLKPGLEGWHRIYVAMESASPHQFTLTGE